MAAASYSFIPRGWRAQEMVFGGLLQHGELKTIRGEVLLCVGPITLGFRRGMAATAEGDDRLAVDGDNIGPIWH